MIVDLLGIAVAYAAGLLTRPLARWLVRRFGPEPIPPGHVCEACGKYPATHTIGRREHVCVSCHNQISAL